MPFKHLFLVFLVIVIWGVNFLFVALGLNEMPPFLLCSIRFILASIPAIFFIKPPEMPFKMVALYGSIMFAMQFSLIFLGMHLGMPPGMASIIMQVQVFFSMFFAAFLLKEKPYPQQILGALVSFMGIGLVATHFDNNISLTGFLCVLAAAASWGIANLITRKYQKVNMISLVIWGSFVAIFPMILLSLIVEGPSSIMNVYPNLSALGITSILYITYGSTIIGYGLWNWLLSRYPVSTMVPFTLLIPIIAILSSVIVLDEQMQTWKWISGVLVLSGLGISLFGGKIFRRKAEAI